MYTKLTWICPFHRNSPRQVAAWRPKCTVSRHTVHLAALMLSPTVKRWAVLWCTALSLSLSLWLSFKRRLYSEYSQGTQWGPHCHNRHKPQINKKGFQKNCMFSKMQASKLWRQKQKNAWKRILIESISLLVPTCCCISKKALSSQYQLLHCVQFCLQHLGPDG